MRQFIVPARSPRTDSTQMGHKHHLGAMPPACEEARTREGRPEAWLRLRGSPAGPVAVDLPTQRSQRSSAQAAGSIRTAITRGPPDVCEG
jgi:hypothetical protein